jgi:hypothetical protein
MIRWMQAGFGATGEACSGEPCWYMGFMITLGDSRHRHGTWPPCGPRPGDHRARRGDDRLRSATCPTTGLAEAVLYRWHRCY